MDKKTIWVLCIIGVVVTIALYAKYFYREFMVNDGTKTCVVTGASSGIGRAIAVTMVRRGWTVIGVARRAERLQELQRELGIAFVPYVCDVRSIEQIHTVSQDMRARNFKPTLFFLNAGTGFRDLSNDVILPQHEDTFATNYFGVIAWVSEWVGDARVLGGVTFVATSSILALFARPNNIAYSASKAALSRAFQGLHLKYYNDNVHFVTVQPGPVATDLIKVEKPLAFTHDPADEAEYIVNKVFAGRSLIEPSVLYAGAMRLLDWLPNWLAAKILA